MMQLHVYLSRHSPYKDRERPVVGIYCELNTQDSKLLSTHLFLPAEESSANRCSAGAVSMTTRIGRKFYREVG
jgi:hypothetical protein